MGALQDIKEIFRKCAYNIFLIGKVSMGRKSLWRETIYPSFIDTEKNFRKQTPQVRDKIHEIRPHATFLGQLTNFCTESTKQAKEINDRYDLGLTINIVEHPPLYGEWYIYDTKKFCAQCRQEEQLDELASTEQAVQVTSEIKDMIFPTQSLFVEETCLWNGRLMYYITEIQRLRFENQTDESLLNLCNDIMGWMDSACSLLNMAKACLGSNEILYENKKRFREQIPRVTREEAIKLEKKYSCLAPPPSLFGEGKMRPIDPDRLCENCKKTLLRPTIAEIIQMMLGT